MPDLTQNLAIAPATTPVAARPQEPVTAQPTLADQYSIESLEQATVPPEVPGGQAQAIESGPAPERSRDDAGRFLPATPTAPPVSPPVAVRTHSARTLRMAHDLGMSQAEIDASSPEVLDEAVYIANRRLLLQATQERRPPDATPPVAASPVVTPPDEYATLEDEFDGRLITAFRAQAKRIADLEQRLQATEQREQVRQVETFAERMDRLFATRPEIFGTKRGREMAGDSPEFVRRRAILPILDTIQGPMDQRFAKAVEMIYGAIPSTPAPPVPPVPSNSVLTPEQIAWMNGGVERPTHRTGSSEPAGRDKAIQSVANYLAGNGQSSPGAGDEFRV